MGLKNGGYEYCEDIIGGKLIIPPSVTSIGNRESSGTSSPSRFTFPESATSIGDGESSGTSSPSRFTIS